MVSCEQRTHGSLLPGDVNLAPCARSTSICLSLSLCWISCSSFPFACYLTSEAQPEKAPFTCNCLFPNFLIKFKATQYLFHGCLSKQEPLLGMLMRMCLGVAESFGDGVSSFLHYKRPPALPQAAARLCGPQGGGMGLEGPIPIPMAQAVLGGLEQGHCFQAPNGVRLGLFIKIKKYMLENLKTIVTRQREAAPSSSLPLRNRGFG